MPCPARLVPFAVSAALLACGSKDGPMNDDTGTVTTGTSPAATSDPETATIPGDSEDPPTSLPTTDVTTTGTGDSDTGAGDSELCVHVGGLAGIGQLVAQFLGNVVNDPRINAYFLRSDLDVARLNQCIIDLLAEAMGCADVTYPCMDMVDAHAGLGISTVDFLDFAEDFGAAWDLHKAQNAHDLTSDEKTAALNVLAGMAPDIVEDLNSDKTFYQRVGRKPAIQDLIGAPNIPGSFIANVLADPSINGFFGATDLVRLSTCLIRQVHGIDGPSTYGLEIDPVNPAIDPGVSLAAPCRPMAESHAGLLDSANMAITFADFNALVGDLVTAMTTAKVPMSDQTLILAALDPLCQAIVAVDPVNCPP